jgi:murein DD-endopeptidase MepM/ murein hydrolase activator NlpD
MLTYFTSLFPTPGPEPISLWRPPLYEAPWALGPHDHFYFSRPIAADVVNWPLADYRYGGMFMDTDIVHTGIDIPNPRGTPVLAAAAGKVVWAGYGLFTGNNNPNDPYGLAITIQHDFGYQSQRLLRFMLISTGSMSCEDKELKPVRR